ncbi:MAG TPA: FAD-dependent oxidoreductase [Desulfitobacterium dehalogenans]|uniref:FAD-dependent oxidoreductase n=1 Tax=Desulfitobacterium dehalogenans TaxID=36854 RepID=A0A7C7D7L7_9FIRM|nr:FAD-dependent oxidoreductase [Desulfitobacterium dehalogenans]
MDSENQKKSHQDAAQGYSRRNFMKGAAFSAAGLAIAGMPPGCASSAPAEPAPTDPPAPSGKDPLAWMTPEAGMFDWRKVPEAPTTFAKTFACDVVVCGAGMAGLSAARSAAEQGLKVIVLEKDDTYDVHGFQCAAINPKMAKDAGAYTDPLKFFGEYVRQHGNRVNNDLIRLWIDKSGEAFDWYEEIMPPAGSDYKTNYRSVLYWPRPGWEEAYKDEAWKHFIGTIDFSYESWKYAGDLLAKKCVDLGCDFHYETPGYMLTQDGTGKINGIIAKIDENTYYKYETTKGVILTTGTFAKNKAMVHEVNASECLFVLRNGGEISYSGLAGGDGDGHMMAVWAGGEMEPWSHAISSSEPLLGPTPGMSINKLGKRYRNEDAPNWMRPIELRSQPDMFGWEIFDANWRDLLPFTSLGHMAIDPIKDTYWTVPPKDCFELANGTKTDGVKRYEDYLEQEILAGVGNPEGVKIGKYVKRPGKVFAANTLEELAKMMGLDAEATENFLAQVKRYNQMCAEKKDTQFGKRVNLMRPIEKAPFLACGAGVDKNGAFGAEGVRVNGELAITNKDGKPIGGLWCAGSLTGGRHAVQYLTPMSGMNHGFCVTLGKLAGEFAAKS